MRSRSLREGSVGLLILAGLAIFGVLVLWLRNVTFGAGNYSFRITFQDAAGLEVGAPVRYRGVQIGRIVDVRAESNGAIATVEIDDSSLLIPRNSLIETNQSGFLGAASIDITPLKPLPEGAKLAKPPSRKCNREMVICSKAQLEGQIGASFDQMLRSSSRFTTLFADPELFADLKSLTKNTSRAAANISDAARELAILEKVAQRELASVSPTLRQVGQAVNQVGLTAGELNQLVVRNRSTLVSTLNNIEQASGDLRALASDLAPSLSQIRTGGLLTNLETLAANSAEASTNLRDLSVALNDPDAILALQQTLDAARVTFQNAQKITSDVDDLTGDPQFRHNLRRLIDGLSGLVSSTQQLQRQAQIAQVLAPMQASANAPAKKANAVRYPQRRMRPAASSAGKPQAPQAPKTAATSGDPAAAVVPSQHKAKTESSLHSEVMVLEMGLAGSTAPEVYSPSNPTSAQ